MGTKDSPNNESEVTTSIRTFLDSFGFLLPMMQKYSTLKNRFKFKKIRSFGFRIEIFCVELRKMVKQMYNSRYNESEVTTHCTLGQKRKTRSDAQIAREVTTHEGQDCRTFFFERVDLKNKTAKKIVVNGHKIKLSFWC